jgi:hypothetical protein
VTSDLIPAPTPRRRPPVHGFTAILLATAPALGGGPAAALAWDGTTLGRRLCDQLVALGAVDIHVVTRPQWTGPLAAHIGDAEVHASPGLADDMRAIAAIAASGDGPVVVANADIVTQGEALAGLLADPRLPTGILVTRWAASRLSAPGVQSRVGQVLAAGTAHHHVVGATERFLGVIKLAAGDRATLAQVAEQAVEVLDRPLPEHWHATAALKERQWRLALYKKAADDDTPLDELEVADADRLELPPEDEAELARRIAAAQQDVTALLLRRLVNANVTIGMGRLRGLFWARPLAPADVEAAAARIAHHDEEKALLGSAVKPTDGFFTTFLVSPYSKYIARWAARRGWSPNFVTCLSMLVGVLAAGAFATGERWGLVLGAVLLQAAFTLDCVDGQLARYTRTFTPLGAWLDSIFDRGKEYVVYAGLAIGAGEDVWLLAGAAIALQTTRHAGDFAFNAARNEAIKARLAVPQFKRDKDDPLLVPYEHVGPKQWARKVFVLPIGERFALISLTAALFDAKVTFLALLAWGGLALAYTTYGRLARSLGPRRETSVTSAVRSGAGPLQAYRDDGAVARVLGRLAGPVGRVPPVALVAAGGLPLLIAGAITREDASWWLVGACVGWAVLCGGLSTSRVLRDRLRWAVPQLLRAIEYGGMIWIAAVASDDADPAAFALLAAIAFRHYDVAYRFAQRGATPPRALGLLLGGWDGRLLAATALGAAGAAAAGLFALAAVIGLLAAGEAVAFWLRGDQQPLGLGDGEE